MKYSYKNLGQDSGWRMSAVSCLWVGTLFVLLSKHNLVRVSSVGFWIGVACFLSALCFLTTRRSTYLPFLSETVLPGSLYRQSQVKVDGIRVTVPVDPSCEKVIYWASTSEGGADPGKAYGEFKNSGVAPVEAGQATLVVDCPGRYYVRGKLLKQHVHYREVFANGITGPVKKADVLCG